MKIYEVTNQLPSKKILAQELSKIYEADAPPDPGFFSKLGSAVKTGLKIFTYYELLWKPVATYIENMKKVEANLAAAGNTPAAIRQFNIDHDTQMGLLVSGLAAGLLVKTILGSIGVFGKFIRFIPGVGAPIGNSIELLSLSAQSWILAELQSEQARTAIAQLLAVSFINLPYIGDMSLPGGRSMLTYIGHLGNKAHDYFEDLFRRALGLKELDRPWNDDSAEPPADPLTPDQNKDLMAKLFGSNQPVEKELPIPGEFLGPGLQRNPTTGKIEMTPLQY